jgi:splicing factor 3A subunit 1
MGGMGGPMGMPMMLPPIHFQGAGGGPGGPGGFVPTGANATGTVRNADQMDTDGSEAPPAKRQKVARLPGGALYAEQAWIDMHPHPVNLAVQLPTDGARPEWKLDGSRVVLHDLPLTLLVSTLRDRIQQQTGSALAASKMRLAFNGTQLRNQNTIASYNLEEDDVLVMSVQEGKKK